MVVGVVGALVVEEGVQTSEAWPPGSTVQAPCAWAGSAKCPGRQHGGCDSLADWMSPKSPAETVVAPHWSEIENCSCHTMPGSNWWVSLAAMLPNEVSTAATIGLAAVAGTLVGKAPENEKLAATLAVAASAQAAVQAALYLLG